MIIAEDRKSSTMAEAGSLPQGYIIHRSWHNDNGRVGGAGGKVFIDRAEPPDACLGNGSGSDSVSCSLYRILQGWGLEVRACLATLLGGGGGEDVTVVMGNGCLSLHWLWSGFWGT